MADRALAALLLTNDPLEAYATKYGSFHDLAALSPAGVFGRVAVAYQARRGGRSEPSSGLTVCRVRALRGRRRGLLRGMSFVLSFAWFVV